MKHVFRRFLQLNLLFLLFMGWLQAAEITYDLTGSLLWADIGASDSLNLSGTSFHLIAHLTNFTPNLIMDPNLNARADYVGIGTLTLGPLTPVVNRVDFVFVDSLPGIGDFTEFAVRTTLRDYIFAVDFDPTANDVLVPPPIYAGVPVLSGSLLIPGATASLNIVYNFVDPQLVVTSIPEPGSLCLLGLGLLFVGVRHAAKPTRV
jgi:hypothetical protein